ncbi:MAG: hypothetical protein M5U33_04590 [Pseudorhodoplanes sp.]|nr:hypothetical protein [Pseudorhodoplanes sp.]
MTRAGVGRGGPVEEDASGDLTGQRAYLGPMAAMTSGAEVRSRRTVTPSRIAPQATGLPARTDADDQAVCRQRETSSMRRRYVPADAVERDGADRELMVP